MVYIYLIFYFKLYTLLYVVVALLNIV